MQCQLQPWLQLSLISFWVLSRLLESKIVRRDFGRKKDHLLWTYLLFFVMAAMFSCFVWVATKLQPASRHFENLDLTYAVGEERISGRRVLKSSKRKFGGTEKKVLKYSRTCLAPWRIRDWRPMFWHFLRTAGSFQILRRSYGDVTCGHWSWTCFYKFRKYHVN